MNGFWSKGTPLDLDRMRFEVDPVADAVVQSVCAQHRDAGVAALLDSLGRSSQGLAPAEPKGQALLGRLGALKTLGRHELDLSFIRTGERRLGEGGPAGHAGLLSRDRQEGTFADRLRERLLAQQPDGSPLPEWAERLCAYFATTAQLPPWTDWKKIERANQLALRYGTLDSLILCCGSLPWCYLDAKGVPVLAATQRLEGKRVYRRIWETSHFVVRAAEPGGLSPDGLGVFFAQRVRLLHAAVRHFLLTPKPPDRDVGGRTASAMRESAETVDWKTLGTPLNQEDMAYVLLTFSYVAIDGLRKLGARPSDEDADAYVHLWNVVGHVMGIRQDLMAATFADAEALFEILLARVRRESDKGRLLTRSLVGWLEEAAPRRMAYVPTIVVQQLVGRENAELLGLRLSARHKLLRGVTLGAIRGLTRLSEYATNEIGEARSGALRKAVYTVLIRTLWNRHRAQWTDIARWPDGRTGDEDAAPAARVVS